MERIPNGRYTKEFREEAVKMAADDGLSVLENLPDRKFEALHH